MSPEPPHPSDDSTRAPDTSARHLIGAQPGDTIGPYRLLQVIGEGGFGVVYLAERRDHITQRVALKVIKPGMDSRSVIARFEQERQALAVMDHPNVAKVFDAGATDRGLPYFVMEHVKGEPITSYCDRHTLTLRKRLELFIPVCEAVQHAHHKGIIHRDLKPANILVTVHDGKPVPKVIDFGIAKAVAHTLTDKTIFTETGQFIGTPEYISPEQAEMGHLDIDTRTDVYSLGVVLYELLTGVLPFDPKSLRAAGYAEIQRIIREVDPPKPSTRLNTADAKDSQSIAQHRRASRDEIARLLRRELDWIPLKALRKDRTERYDTPSALAEDIEHYLNGEPLDAGPESTAYRLRKFLRRYRRPVVAAALVFLALSIGLGTALWQAQEAAKQRDLAESHLFEARSALRPIAAMLADTERDGNIDWDQMLISFAESSLGILEPDDLDLARILVGVADIYDMNIFGPYFPTQAKREQCRLWLESAYHISEYNRAADMHLHARILDLLIELESAEHRDQPSAGFDNRAAAWQRTLENTKD